MIQLEVSIPVALEQNFTYLTDAAIPSGCRVLVPFGERNRKTVGVVIGPSLTSKIEASSLKQIIERLDIEPAYSPALMQLARWISQYYLYPLGEVLRSMLPASQTKNKVSKVKMTDLGESVWRNSSHSLYPLFRELWKRRAAVASSTWKKRLILFLEKNPGAKVSLRSLEKAGFLEKEASQTTSVRRWKDFEQVLESEAEQEPKKVLSRAQQEVLTCLISSAVMKPEEKKPVLLHGVTGAGKTEIYLQLISHFLAENPEAQALVLVPEIALTPQMTRVFTQRFPGDIAVVHSAMTPVERWAQLTSIRQRQKHILIGPRSAVFAPFASLKLIIVDEEHDASYKQGAGLSYNGRDVAIMRAHLEKTLVVLGSATPSMESYANAEQGKYQLLALQERALGRPMPAVTLIEPEMSQSYAKRLHRPGIDINLLDLPVDNRILEALRENHAKGLQSMVLVNRRGYAYYLFSLKERKAVACPNCSISLTVHKNSSILRCHYCDYQTRLDQILKLEEREAYVLVGYGSEQMEMFLSEALPGSRIQRVDSDTMSQRDALARILEEFRSGRIDVLVGTQMLAKGHDFAKVTLICILEIDQTLNLPDFRAGERTYQLLVQAAGRAGRDAWPGEVLIQSQKRDHPVLQAGLSQNYAAFWEGQKEFRMAHAYPPYSRMILFELSGTKKELLLHWTKAINQWLAAAQQRFPQELSTIQILGPSIPPIEMIRGRLRRTLLLVSSNLKNLWALARHLKSDFAKLPGDLHLRIDVDPQSLM